MHLYYLFAGLAAGSFLTGVIAADKNRDSCYLAYGIFGVVIFLVACAISGHAGM